MKKYFWLFYSLVLPRFVSAQVPDFGLKVTADAAGIPTNTADPVNIVARIINLSLSVLGVILLILTLYSGWLWMTSSGNEEKVTKAKKLMASTLIGLVIVVASYAIAQYIYLRLKIAAG